MENLRLQEVVVFLVAAGLVIPVFKRLKVSAVLGFLLIGVIVGPHGLARFAEQFTWLRYVLITDVEGVQSLAELGVVFLLFMIGLELSLTRVWGARRLVFGLGGAQILCSGAIIGAIAFAFGNSLAASVVLGASLALSSTAIVLQLIQEQGRFGTVVGYGSFSILLAQDIAVVPILFAVGALSTQASGSVIASLGIAIAQAVVTVALILIAGRVLVRPFLRFVSVERSPEVFMAGTLLIIVATSVITHAAGLSAALGAFLVGLLLAETEFRHEIEVNIEPFKGLLLGLFFMSVGMRIDLTTVLNDPVWIALAVAGLFAIKTTIATGLALGFRFTRAQALEIGLLLSQGGEFAFIVIGMAVTFALLPEHTAQFMLIVVSATMLLTPTMARLGRNAGIALEHRDSTTAPEIEIPQDLKDHVVIVGFGRTGQLLARLLDEQQIAHVALELNVIQIAEQRARGAPVFLGDASRRATLEKARLKNATALVVSIDNAEASERVVAAARAFAPQLPIFARARHRTHAQQLYKLGATHVVSELLESSLQLGQLMLQAAGLPDEAAREMIDARRAIDQGQASAIDI